MNLRICVLLALTAAAMNTYSAPAESIAVNTGSLEELTESIEQVRLKHGDGEARDLIKNIALVIGNNFSSPQLDKSYGEGDTQTVLNMLDRLRNEALLEIDGMTIGELKTKAEPLEHEYRLDRKQKAQARLPAFQEEKDRVMKVQAFRDNLDLVEPEFTRNKDEMGFPTPEFSVTLNNKSDTTIRAIDVDVHAWSTMDPDIKGSSQIRFKFAHTPVKPGDSIRVTQAVSPISTLAEAVANGAGQGSRMQLLVVYTAEDGRTEMTGDWTEQMEANLKRLEEYASYESEQD